MSKTDTKARILYIYKMLLQETDKEHDITIQQIIDKLLIEGISSDKTYLAEYYGLPEEDGWEITYFYVGEMGTVINYKYNEKTVTFSQEVIRENMGNINTENAVVEPISIYEENDGFIIDYGENGDVLLTWIYDGYLLSISSNLNKNETVNLAYSTKIVDF